MPGFYDPLLQTKDKIQSYTPSGFHADVAGEIDGITAKAAPLVAADKFLIEDSADSWKKKYVTLDTIFTAPTITDFTNAQHDHLDAEGGGLLDVSTFTGILPELQKSGVIIWRPGATSDGRIVATWAEVITLMQNTDSDAVIIDSSTSTATVPAGSYPEVRTICGFYTPFRSVVYIDPGVDMANLTKLEEIKVFAASTVVNVVSTVQRQVAMINAFIKCTTSTPFFYVNHANATFFSVAMHKFSQFIEDVGATNGILQVDNASGVVPPSISCYDISSINDNTLNIAAGESISVVINNIGIGTTFGRVSRTQLGAGTYTYGDMYFDTNMILEENKLHFGDKDEATMEWDNANSKVLFEVNSVLAGGYRWNTARSKAQFYVPDGNSFAPGLCFGGTDFADGMFRSSASLLAVSTGGLVRGGWDATGTVIEDGTIASPSWHFRLDTNTGVTNDGTVNQMYTVLNGVASVLYNTTSMTVNPNQASNVDFIVHGDTNTKMFDIDVSDETIHIDPVYMSIGKNSPFGSPSSFVWVNRDAQSTVNDLVWSDWIFFSAGTLTIDSAVPEVSVMRLDKGFGVAIGTGSLDYTTVLMTDNVMTEGSIANYGIWSKKGLCRVNELETDTYLNFEKASGYGIRIDPSSPDYGWRDIIGNVTTRNTGGSKPTFTTYRDTIQQYQFSAGNEEFYDFHLPHDYAEGTDIHLHVHWSHTGTLVTGGSCTFEYEVTYSKGHDQAPFPASVTNTFVGNASTTQYQHIITEIVISDPAPAATELDTDDLEVDGLILCRVELNANNITVSGGAVPDPFIHFVDIHYQSTGIPTKQKAPDFYV